MQVIRSLNPLVVTGICDPNKSEHNTSQFETWFEVEVSRGSRPEVSY